MISRQHNKNWKRGKKEFWDKVASELPSEWRKSVERLRESLERQPADRKSYDPDLIYHCQPEDVAQALLAGGYQNLESPPPGNVFEFLKKQEGLESLVDESDHEMSN